MPHPLQTVGLTVGYTSPTAKRVLCDVDVHLCPGEVVAFLGANGVGKTTLLRTLGGELSPLVGTVLLGGDDVQWMSPAEVARRVAFVYTDRPAAGGLTVEELVSLGRNPYTGFLGVLSASDRDAVHHAMEAVGIAYKSHCMMASLSDGERQKAMIARALAQDTPIIILDEPTAFLDVASRLEVMALLKSLARDHRRSVLVSSHDISAALAVADRLWLALPQRRAVAEGHARDLLRSPLMDQLYPGRNLRFDPELNDFVSI